MEEITRRNFIKMAAALSAAPFALCSCKEKKEDKYIPVTIEQQKLYDKLQEGRFDKITSDIECDVITAVFVDSILGGDGSHLSYNAASFFQSYTKNKEKFYTLTTGPKKGASTNAEVPYTNNPNDYCLPKQNVSRQMLFNERSDIEEAIRNIEKKTPNARLSYIEVENPPDYAPNTPFLVTYYFRNNGTSFVKEKVLGYKHRIILAPGSLPSN
jgi:hypothetical protein